MYKGNLFHIPYLEGGARGICGGAVAGGARLCIYAVDECNKDSHILA